LGVYHGSRTSDNIFTPEGALLLKIVEAGYKLMAGDVIGYEFRQDMMGTHMSPLHMALVLQSGADSGGNPEIMDMDENGISVTRWVDFSDFVLGRHIVRLQLVDDSAHARQRAVAFARDMYRRFRANPDSFPKYHVRWWNCDSFVCACLTQGACTVSGQVLNAAALGARILTDVAHVALQKKTTQ
jgi:hypothetical protein